MAEANPQSEAEPFDDDQLSGVTFDDLIPLNPDGEWVRLEEGAPIVGTLLGFEDDVGENNSRLYRMQLAQSYPALERDGDVREGDVAIFYGAAQLDQEVDRGGVGRGTILGIERTGETYETENGQGHVFDIRTADKEV